MLDLHWLSQEASSIHQFFTGIFYAFVTVLLLLGVLTEYFKIPIGPGTDLTLLVGRVFIAALLLHSYPEVTHALSSFTDAVADKLGGFNEFHLVLSRMGEKASKLSWSWTSIKDSLILLFSFVTFFVLYISVFIANGGIVYAWILLYVFSPLLIALFVLPATSFATKALYRSLIEVCAWKIVWSVLAALLWSSALGEMNHEESELNFLTVIVYNLVLAISLVLTPLVVHALASSGISQATGNWLGLAAGAAVFSPGVLAKATLGKTIAGTKAQSFRGVSAAGSFLKNIATPEKKKTTQSSVNLTPPAWHKRVPPPNEPPEWMKSRLEQEKNK